MNSIKVDSVFYKRLLFAFSVLSVLAFIFLFLFHQVPLIRAAPKNTITVGSLADSGGSCTLRSAILSANTNMAQSGCVAGSAGADTITFGVTGSITLLSALPPITDSLTISGNTPITISGNSLYQVFYVNPGVQFNLNNLTIRNGKGNPNGGAIYNSGATVSITSTNFLTNTTASSGTGGAILNTSSGTLNLTNSYFSGNSSDSYGGAIETDSGTNLRVVNTNFTNNAATGSGGSGAIDTDSPSLLSILNSTFVNNSTSSNNAGAIWIFSMSNAATIGNSTFLNNTAGSGGYGGGIRIESAPAIITNSTFVGNGANNGAGIAITNSTTTITNSTLSGNKANVDGGGILVEGASNATLNNVTIANNIADFNNDGSGDGGGINNSSSTITITNTLVAYNVDKGGQAPNCSGTVTNGGNNLQYPGATCGGIATSDPKLGPLGYYGGPTLVHSLLTGSVALNAGSNAACAATDQRGVVRPHNGGDPCDIGAFEGVGYGIYTPLITR